MKNIATGKETKYPLGEVGAPAGAAAPAGPPVFLGGASLAFSDDSKWIAFNTSPARAEAQRLRRQRRPVQGGVMVVNLASGEKKEYPRIRRFDVQRGHLDAHRPASRSSRARTRRRRRGRGGSARARWPRWRRGRRFIRPATRHRLDPSRAGDRRRIELRQRFGVRLHARRQVPRLGHRRHRQDRQRRAAPQHADRHGQLARHGHRELRAPVVDGKGRGADRPQGQGRPRLHRQACTRSSASPDSASGEPKKTEYDPSKDTDFPKGFCDQRQPRRDLEREDRRIRVRHPRTAQAHDTPATPGTTSTTEVGRAAGHAADRPCGSGRGPG